MLKLFDIPETPVNTKNEWYTPSQYIEAAREVMGSIDLDPASCELANRTVKATRYYTQEEDGLQQEWYGNVWLNPPYGSLSAGNGEGRLRGGGRTATSMVYKFVRKLIDAYEKEHVSQAFLLVTSDTDASWFIPLWNYPICFANHRVSFHRPNLQNMGQFFGTCFVYLGSNEAKFIDVFSQFGTIAKRVN